MYECKIYLFTMLTQMLFIDLVMVEKVFKDASPSQRFIYSSDKWVFRTDSSMGEFSHAQDPFTFCNSVSLSCTHFNWHACACVYKTYIVYSAGKVIHLKLCVIGIRLQSGHALYGHLPRSTDESLARLSLYIPACTFTSKGFTCTTCHTNTPSPTSIMGVTPRKMRNHGRWTVILPVTYLIVLDMLGEVKRSLH